MKLTQGIQGRGVRINQMGSRGVKVNAPMTNSKKTETKFICTSDPSGQMNCTEIGNETNSFKTDNFLVEDCIGQDCRNNTIQVTCPQNRVLDECNLDRDDIIAEHLSEASFSLIEVSTKCKKTSPPQFPTVGSINIVLGALTSSQNGCFEELTREYIITDACGNTVRCHRTVSYRSDNNGPEICPEHPGPTDLGCNPSEQQINDALGDATYVDTCECIDGELNPIHILSDTSGNSGYTDKTVANGTCGWIRTRKFWAKDYCKNYSEVSVSVTWKTDTSAPVIVATGTPQNGQLGCNPTPAQIEAALGTATTTENCGNVVPVPSDGPVQSNGCDRQQTRTWTATDACGNVATPVSRTAYWVEDLTPPVIHCPPPTKTIQVSRVVEDCNGGGVVWTPPQVENACSGNVTITSVDLPDKVIKCRKWIVTDACGNTSTCIECVLVEPCQVDYKGCTLGFWKNTPEIWDDSSDTIAATAGFVTTTSFWTFLGIAPGTASLPTSLTMLEALNLGGGGCYNLARQGVAALLSSAAFGSSYNYPPGVTNFAQLKAAIATALYNNNCSTLASQLDDANNNEDGNVCGALKQFNVQANRRVNNQVRNQVSNKTVKSSKSGRKIPSTKNTVVQQKKKNNTGPVFNIKRR